MKKIILIEGMTCNHCVNHVTKALEELGGVKKVKVNLNKNNAVVDVEDTVNNEELKQAIDDIGYKVINIEDKKGLFS